MAEGDAEGVDDADVGEGDEHARADERRRAHHLDPDDEVSDADDQRLDDRENGEEEEAAEVGLPHREALEPLGINLGAEDDHEYERADP